MWSLTILYFREEEARQGMARRNNGLYGMIDNITEAIENNTPIETKQKNVLAQRIQTLENLREFTLENLEASQDKKCDMAQLEKYNQEIEYLKKLLEPKQTTKEDMFSNWIASELEYLIKQNATKHSYMDIFNSLDLGTTKNEICELYDSDLTSFKKLSIYQKTLNQYRKIYHGELLQEKQLTKKTTKNGMGLLALCIGFNALCRKASKL